MGGNRLASRLTNFVVEQGIRLEGDVAGDLCTYRDT
jgi:hypothetical protein